ncbi:hypothetical protein PR002_g13464 [Phytophthora rubi]|uniref:Uncharacterized protein n=1 Tax=Phytophthora rubi TaxID=129364 RepID=A0A6A3LCL0_9STRA|nr:hypothetical protein PR002_g13464 [Phytophthora rubi]
MARTKVVMQPSTRVAKKQLEDQTQTSVPAPAGGSTPRRQEDQDEETKGNESDDADNSSDERHDHGAVDTQDAPPADSATGGNEDGAAIAPVAALTAALQQMAMARIDARLNQLSATAVSPVPTPTPGDTGTQTVESSQRPADTTNPPTQSVTQQAPPATPRNPPLVATARHTSHATRMTTETAVMIPTTGPRTAPTTTTNLTAAITVGDAEYGANPSRGQVIETSTATGGGPFATWTCRRSCRRRRHLSRPGSRAWTWHLKAHGCQDAVNGRVKNFITS